MLERIGIPAWMTFKVISVGILPLEYTHTLMQGNIVPQSVADHFIQSIVPSDIFAGKQNVIFLSENAAMCGKGNAMERRTIRKGIRHMKDPFWFPENRCK